MIIISEYLCKKQSYQSVEKENRQNNKVNYYRMEEGNIETETLKWKGNKRK